MSVNWKSLFPTERQTQELLIVCVLSLLGLLTRAYGIWKWPITGDEYFTIANVEERATGIIGSAYYILVGISQAIFGETTWSARLPAVVLGVLGIPAFYLLCRRLFNWRAATIGCVFIILSEWHLYHSQMARFYSGVFLFGAMSYYFFYVSLKDNSYTYLFGSLFSSLLAVSFHATSIFIVVSCGAFSAFLLLYAWGREVGFSKSVAGGYLSLCVLSAVALLPKLISIAGEWGTGYGGLTADVLSTMLGMVENIGVIIFVSSFAGLVYLLFVDFNKFYLFVVLILVPIASLFVLSVVLPPARPRYMFYSLPLFFALSSFFCADMAGRVGGYFSSNAGLALVFSCVMGVSFISHYTGKMSLDVGDPAKFVEENYKDSDRVVVFGWSIKNQLDNKVDVSLIKSKSFWDDELVPIAEKEGRTWVIIDTYRTAPLRRDLEAWLMENASLKWRKEETRFDYTQRGYEVWLETSD